MPIKFRCTYCNQRMGIAHRKAGTEVECPACKAKVLVPHQSEEPPPAPASAAPSPPLFEQSDFGDFLNGGGQQQEPALIVAPQSPALPPKPAPQPRALRLPSSYDMDPLPGTMGGQAEPNPPGIVLSPAKATLLTVAVILGLALAFSAGLLVGRAL